MKLQLVLALAAIVASCFSSNVNAAQIKFSVDDQPEVSVDCDWFVIKGTASGKWVIRDTQWGYDTGPEGNGATVQLSGVLDADPVISFSLAVVDFGAPSNFSFSFVMPVIPTVTNPSTVSDSFSGTVGNATGPGVTVTANAPPAGIPVDDDGIEEIQVFTLSTDGVDWQNVGLDQGPTTFVPLAPSTTGSYGVYNAGPIATIAGGPWKFMRADINFGLSGGGDSFSFNGAKVLSPEPGTMVLALLAMGSFGFIRRRK